jgi:triosephosphate isomerase
MVRKFFVGGNWKMNGSKATNNEIIEFLVNGPLDENVGQS